MATTNKLLRRFRRELKNSPKKAAALALLLAVAVWFWMPLVLKWNGQPETNENTHASQTGAAVAENQSVPSTALNGDTDSKTKTIPWKQVLSWIQNDRFMHPQVPQAGARDPFGPTEGRRLAQEKAAPALPELTPQEVGLALQSTVIGPKAKTALINDKVYHEGQTVVATNGTERFKLVKIHSDSVVLDHNGKLHELKLPRVEMAGSDE